jgi:cytochrome c-type biogenesis protein CcmE
MTRKRRRMAIVLACAPCLGLAVALSLSALGNDLEFFVSPSTLLQKAAPGRTLRLGGLVEAGSVTRVEEAGQPVAHFRITDGHAAVAVAYRGILPDLFREGQGVVTLGTVRPDGTFGASEVLAKHDETYMPKEVAEALKRSGEWRPESGQSPRLAKAGG